MNRQTHVLLKVFVLVIEVSLIFVISSEPAQKLSASNISCYIGNGKWDWTIFIIAAQEVLEDIKCVEYTLPQTFPEPIRKVCNLGDSHYPFGLTSIGKGIFEISIKVIFKDEKVFLLKHMLNFEPLQVEGRLPIRASNDSTYMGSGQWDWTVFITGPPEILDRILLVKYTLHPSFSDPEQEVFDRGEGRRGFALSGISWGVFKIHIRLFLKNGQIQDLKHDLKF